MQIFIRLAKASDLKSYTNLLQKVYQKAYVSPELGLTPECFSLEIFQTPDTQKYLAGNLHNSDYQKTWLAFNGKELIGSVTIENKNDDSELRGFYVAEKYQHQGIGKQLWQKAIAFAGSNDLTLDIYCHNKNTIKIYEKWGFEEDKDRGHFFRHWPEWPAGVQAEAMFMRKKGTTTS